MGERSAPVRGGPSLSRPDSAEYAAGLPLSGNSARQPILPLPAEAMSAAGLPECDRLPKRPVSPTGKT